MKTSLRLQLVTLATATLGLIGALSPAIATNFGQKEIDTNKFIAVAAPRGRSDHQLLVLEQVSDARPCWSETGASPVVVDPLLLNFDFTGICGRSTDSNGYSIRMAGQDLGLQYSLRVIRKDSELVLVGTSTRDRNAPQIEIGRTQGLAQGFSKIFLDPGWRFTKRTFGDRTLGHVYLTTDTPLSAVTPAPAPTPSPVTPSPVVVTPPAPAPSPAPVVVSPTPNPLPGSVVVTPIPTPSSGGVVVNPIPTPGPVAANPTPNLTSQFRDIANDIYAREIQEAVTRGFVAGFSEDSTFRPEVSLTREQLVSLVLESLSTLPNANFTVPSQATSRPYSDVDASRWSAAKIQFARDNNIVSGYSDGSFRPSQPVTRAELMAVLRRAAEYGQSRRGMNPALTFTQPERSFADTGSHWAAPLISQMSSYCNVASPVNEVGSTFAPNSAARRNYAAAATLRMLKCVEQEQS